MTKLNQSLIQGLFDEKFKYPAGVCEPMWEAGVFADDVFVFDTLTFKGFLYLS